MCGIAGIVAPSSASRDKAIDRMIAALNHRGPDGSGKVHFDNCVLGHTRLSIVDFKTGSQPMLDQSSNKNVGITFNGEIYGYNNLRKEYRNYHFKTESDTELLLAAYEKHGDNLAHFTPGMFSFAIWDNDCESLIAARDRFGEKPFFYAFGTAGEFIFASEIKAILASRLLNPSIDMNSVYHYFQRLYVPVEQTIYSNIHTLPPACRLTHNQRTHNVSKYWDPPSVQESLTIDEADEELQVLMCNAVKAQMVADVPVGAFLSGGLDSTTIVSFAAKQIQSLRTFSFDFKGSFSESGYAKLAAEKYGTQHSELTVNWPDLAQTLLEVTDAYDEPFADSSSIPTYLLCKKAREHTKVALTGDGGDEMFGGYSWYKPLYWMAKLGRANFLTYFWFRVAARSAKILKLDSQQALEDRNVGGIFSRRFNTILDAHNSQMKCFFSDNQLADFGLSKSDEQKNDLAGNDGFDAVFAKDIADYMAGDILTKIDRASMAHGLELRAPFLDVELAEFCISLPWRLKVSKNSDKLMLRHSFAADWPAPIRQRSKQGFGAPISEWLGNNEIQDIFREMVTRENSALFQVLNFKQVEKSLPKLSPIQNWVLLVFSVWIDRNKSVLNL